MNTVYHIFSSLSKNEPRNQSDSLYHKICPIETKSREIPHEENRGGESRSSCSYYWDSRLTPLWWVDDDLPLDQESDRYRKVKISYYCKTPQKRILERSHHLESDRVCWDSRLMGWLWVLDPISDLDSLITRKISTVYTFCSFLRFSAFSIRDRSDTGLIWWSRESPSRLWEKISRTDSDRSEGISEIYCIFFAKRIQVWYDTERDKERQRLRLRNVFLDSFFCHTAYHYPPLSITPFLSSKF